MDVDRVDGQDANGAAAAPGQRLSASWPGIVAPRGGAASEPFSAPLAALEHRLTLLEEAGGARTGGRQEPLETRITLLEQRFSLLDEDVLALSERLDLLETAGPSSDYHPSSEPSPPMRIEAVGSARDEDAHDDIARLTTRLSEMEGDLRSTVERVSILRATELVSVPDQTSAPAGADPQAVEDLRRELGELRSAVEALVMALSLGLGRQAA